MSQETPNFDVQVGPANGHGSRLVIVHVDGEERHRDRFNTDSDEKRRRFRRRLVAAGVDASALDQLDAMLVQGNFSSACAACVVHNCSPIALRQGE